MDTIILECIDCAGSVQLTNKLEDERYQLSHCPYCGSDDVEIDTINQTEQ